MMILGLVAVNAKYIHTNLPLRYLRQRFHEPSQFYFFEYTINYSIDDAYAELLTSGADRLLVSMYIWNAQWIDALMGALKSVKPDLKIYVGGPEAESHEVLQSVYPWADVLLKGDLDAIESDEDLKRVLDTDAMQVELGKGFMASLPFAYTDEELSSLAMIYYESDRGCPFQCSFCMASRQKRMEQRPLDLVYHDLLRFMHAGVSQVKFVDRTFNRDKVRAVNIIDFILEQDLGKTHFHFELAPHLIDLSLIERVAKAPEGLFQFEIGLQSYCAETLNAIHRNPSQNMQLDGVKSLIKTGKAHIHIDLIAGLPYETLGSFQQGFNRLMELRPHMIQLGFLKLLRGTDLYDDQGAYDYHVRPYPPYEVLSSHTMSAEDLVLLKRVEVCVEVYYNTHRFENIMAYLLSCTADPFQLFVSLADMRLKHHKKGCGSTSDDYELLLAYGKALCEANGLILVDLLKLDYVSHFSSPTMFFKPHNIKLSDAIHARLSDENVQRTLFGDGFRECIPVKELLKWGQFVEMAMDLRTFFRTGEVSVKPKLYFVMKKKNAKHILPRFAYIDLE